VLALTPASFQLDLSVVTIVTLKRRKSSIREVPIPPQLSARLDRCFGIRRLQRGEHSAAMFDCADRPLNTACTWAG
jgi:hypothetical protein